MTTTVTKTVKSSGGDYSSLSAWEAGQQGNLVTANEIRQAECYDFSDTTAVSIDGWTTSSTQYPRVFGHTQLTKAGYDSTKYCLYNTTSQSLLVSTNNTHLFNLQCVATGTSQNAIWIQRFGGSVLGVRVEQCVAVGDGSGMYIKGSSTDAVVRNCVSICNNGSGIYGDDSVCVIANCVAIASAAKSFYGIGFCGAVTNSYAAQGGGSFGSYYGNTSITTCASDDSSGSSGLTGIAYSTSSGAYFTNVTSGSEDFHIGASSALKDAGTDLSSDFTTDFDGQTRPTGAGTWDIGVDEIVAATGGGTPPRRIAGGEHLGLLLWEAAGIC